MYILWKGVLKKRHFLPSPYPTQLISFFTLYLSVHKYNRTKCTTTYLSLPKLTTKSSRPRLNGSLQEFVHPRPLWITCLLRQLESILVPVKKVLCVLFRCIVSTSVHPSTPLRMSSIGTSKGKRDTLSFVSVITFHSCLLLFIRQTHLSSIILLWRFLFPLHLPDLFISF